MKADIIPSVSHVRRACGKDNKIVVRCRQGVVDMYEKPETRNPSTAEQQRTRAAFGENTAMWVHLPAEVKAEWNAFAAAHGRAFGRPSAEPMTGYRLYQSAGFFRKLLGLGDPPSAPARMPPPLPERVELLPSAEADTLRLRFEHKLKPGSFSVVVSMTPPTLRPSRKPDERHKRYVKGLDAASTAPLPASGGEVMFTGCRSSVAPGQRFGVWVRIIRHGDGLASPELALDFIRPEADPDPDLDPDPHPEPESEPVSPPAPEPVGQAAMPAASAPSSRATELQVGPSVWDDSGAVGGRADPAIGVAKGPGPRTPGRLPRRTDCVTRSRAVRGARKRDCEEALAPCPQPQKTTGAPSPPQQSRWRHSRPPGSATGSFWRSGGGNPERDPEPLSRGPSTN